MKTRATYVVLAALTLTGCATTLNPEYQSSLDSWVGSPVLEFFGEHREPDSMIDMIDYRVYIWNNSRSGVYSSPGTTTCVSGVYLGSGITSAPSCTTYGGGATSYTYTCAWELRVEKNVITAATLTGDSCKKGHDSEKAIDVHGPAH